MEYSYRRVATNGFERIREAIEREVPLHGFAVAGVHDLQATLAAKGFPIQPLCIYELVLDSELSGQDGIALLTPCRLHVYVEEGEVWVGAIRPTLMALMFPEARIEVLASKVEERVVGLVDSAVA
ncbi:MAG: hypothetical protein C0418_00835 [Coriobacteriaceae bacterium]|nr:hypothetical protein [Coriobacteriaceae bacterium]